ncbi:peptidase S41-like protein [Sphingobacterium allocomposti]|uniref:Peptidase S41-like protein n=1 Tax=Sphingobacterium allocomposti TaxID=415956 RepID=A0A5S5DIW7_9SPHI|nr:S41 family peptidase [Sphingobacterium composti Yoo et al. 2007 non Ten et al. 2007]TYP95900.1 peptidase S41-like protein [Sphingobacterium composti Yoo et al. 2007 non Ten et al. 2007]
MKTMKYIAVMGMAFFLFACKKEVAPPEPKPEPVEDTKEQLIRDSIYYYYNLYSLWTERVPDHDVLRTFTANYSSYDAVLTALKALTPAHPGYRQSGGYIDRFSYYTEISAGGQVSRYGHFRMDNNDGYGLYISFGVTTDTTANPVIHFVEGGSPAQKAGIKRGHIITALNGDDKLAVKVREGINEKGEIVYYIDDQAAYTDVVTKLSNALERSALTLTIETASGSSQDYALQYTTYAIDPVVADTVYKFPSKNIGYLAFSSFEEVDNNSPNHQKFEKIFTSFKEGGITELILDMRYNTGGYVSTAEYLANKIIHPAGDGQLMFTYEVNDYLTRYKTGRNAEFADVYFSRNNDLSLQTVYVLVTESTASAAELLISVLKPYLDVRLIAETNRTYGKPVGFFEQKVHSTISLWVTSFKTINKDGYTDFWDGMAVDRSNVEDYIFKDFGDPTESMIAAALDLAGVRTSSSNKASINRSATPARVSKSKLGVVNQVEERNMLK